MKLKYQELEIRMQSGHSILRKIVPAWETPVLQAINEEITVIRDVCEERDPPSVSAEMGRLIAAYGAEREEGGITGISYAESVYGQHAIGIESLRRVMQASVLPKNTPVTPQVASPTIRQDLLQSLHDVNPGDDLIGEVNEESEEEALDA
jgi:hypothetical protein